MSSTPTTNSDVSNVSQLVTSIKNIVGPSAWNEKLHSNTAKMSLLQALQSVVNTSNPISLTDAMNLLVELNVITQPPVIHSLQLSAQLIPPSVILTVQQLFTMLGQIATQHPNATTENKKAIAESTAQLQQLPDTQMTAGQFFQVLSTVINTPPTSHHTSKK